MFQKLFTEIKRKEDSYLALAEAARLLDLLIIEEAIKKGIDIDSGKSGEISIVQILAENCKTEDEEMILHLLRTPHPKGKKLTELFLSRFKLYRFLFERKSRRQRNEELLLATHEGEIPKDLEGYIISYDVDDAEGIQKFFSIYGFVVIRDVLNNQECMNTINEIWQVQTEQSGGLVRREDQKTWEDHWPGIVNEGISGGYTVVKPQFVQNRCNRKIYDVACLLLSESRLLTNIDRFGIFRPTKDHSEWKTRRNIHLDMNPIQWYESTDQEEAVSLNSLNYQSGLSFNTENNFIESRLTANGKIHLQGLINLEDNREEDGGFLICPGYHLKLEKIIAERLELWRKQFGSINRFCVLPEKGNEDIHNSAIRVTARAGSLVLWSQLNPHGSEPNNSDRFRYAQFIKLFPADSVDSDRATRRKAGIKKMLNEGHISELSNFGKRLHGLKSW